MDLLEINPRNQEALAGLAECYWKSNDGRLEETLSKLLDLNPHHPRAKAIQVEQMLDSGDWRDALKAVEERLAVNPVEPGRSKSRGSASRCSSSRCLQDHKASCFRKKLL